MRSRTGKTQSTADFYPWACGGAWHGSAPCSGYWPIQWGTSGRWGQRGEQPDACGREREHTRTATPPTPCQGHHNTNLVLFRRTSWFPVLLIRPRQGLQPPGAVFGKKPEAEKAPRFCSSPCSPLPAQAPSQPASQASLPQAQQRPNPPWSH